MQRSLGAVAGKYGIYSSHDPIASLTTQGSPDSVPYSQYWLVGFSWFHSQVFAQCSTISAWRWISNTLKQPGDVYILLATILSFQPPPHTFFDTPFAIYLSTKNTFIGRNLKVMSIVSQLFIKAKTWLSQRLRSLRCAAVRPVFPNELPPVFSSRPWRICTFWLLVMIANLSLCWLVLTYPSSVTYKNPMPNTTFSSMHRWRALQGISSRLPQRLVCPI